MLSYKMQSVEDQLKIVNTLNWTAIPALVKYVNEQLAFLAPHTGDYKMSAQSNDFDGWLVCDGRSVSRSNYKELYDVVGTSFGTPANSNIFVLPDLRGKVFGSVGQGSNLTNRTLGGLVGEEAHVLTSSEMPSHTHSATAAAAGTHTHNILNAGSHEHTITDPGHKHDLTTINDDFNSSGTNPPGFTQDSAGTRTWTDVVNNATTGISINSSGDHTHTISSVADHIHSISLSDAGGNNAHNVMQPTLFAGKVFIFSGFKKRL